MDSTDKVYLSYLLNSLLRMMLQVLLALLSHVGSEYVAEITSFSFSLRMLSSSLMLAFLITLMFVLKTTFAYEKRKSLNYTFLF